MRRVVGVLLTVLGLTLAGVPVAELVMEHHETAQAQQRLRAQVPEQAVVRGGNAVPVAHPVPVGHALVEMRIPRFGESWSWVASEGTSQSVLADGPGHYPQTPLPGQRGNVSFAAHRAGHGDPFLDFDRLRPGDVVELRQGQTTWTYVIDIDPKIVPASAAWVLDPLPGRQLTLTTCWPKYGSSKRMYVRAHLSSA
ncbi:MAG TPA: sortase [Nocardioides sp.]|uniref:sortase n=1 Tax=Nocardioides sp. TaxID=35761 RepID=UPI002E347057|nr:sortase [Nocardioides sp.]HEX5088155.1 sortase [Nocardioides sp.]